MSKPTIGYANAFWLCLGLAHAGANTVFVQAAINPDTTPQNEYAVDKSIPALAAIRGAEQLTEQIQMQKVTRGEAVIADQTWEDRTEEHRTEENKKALEHASEIAEGIDKVKDALELADNAREDAEEGLDLAAAEANLARDIRPDEGPVSIVEVGQRLGGTIERARDEAIANLDGQSDRSADDMHTLAALGKRQIELAAADMQASNAAFEKRIENEPVESRDALMEARVGVQSKILAEKADAVVAELSPSEPAHEDPTLPFDPNR